MTEKRCSDPIKHLRIKAPAKLKKGISLMHVIKRDTPIIVLVPPGSSARCMYRNVSITPLPMPDKVTTKKKARVKRCDTT